MKQLTILRNILVEHFTFNTNKTIYENTNLCANNSRSNFENAAYRRIDGMATESSTLADVFPSIAEMKLNHFPVLCRRHVDDILTFTDYVLEWLSIPLFPPASAFQTLMKNKAIIVLTF